MRHHQLGEWVGIVAAGQAEVMAAGRRTVLHEGDWFGGGAVLRRVLALEDDTDATVRAITDTDVELLGAEAFLRRIGDEPGLAAEVIRSASRHSWR